MPDLKSSRLIYLKGFLFLLILVASSSLILLEHPEWRVSIFLLLTIWSAARLYYCMFYVIERYVDPAYRFAGIFSFVTYMFSRSGKVSRPVSTPTEHGPAAGCRHGSPTSEKTSSQNAVHQPESH